MMPALAVIFYQDIPLPAFCAFLLEALMLLAVCLERVRRRLENCCAPAALACMMVLSALPSYAIYTAPVGAFQPVQLLWLAALAAAVAFWYVALPHNRVTDLLLLAVMAGVSMARIFGRIYPEVAEKLPGQLLGELMWLRLGIVAVLVIRKLPGIDFGLVPTREHWIVGAQQFSRRRRTRSRQTASSISASSRKAQKAGSGISW